MPRRPRVRRYRGYVPPEEVILTPSEPTEEATVPDVHVIHPDGTEEWVPAAVYEEMRQDRRRQRRADRARKPAQHSVAKAATIGIMDSVPTEESPVAPSATDVSDVITEIRSRRFRTTEDYLLIDSLKVDLLYHRPFDQSHARKMLAEAGGEYIEEVGRYILISRRPDGDYIIAGLHRAQMARMVGQEFIPAVIIHGITVAQEAALADVESGRRKESQLDVFRQQFVAGKPEVVAIVNIVERNGTRVHLGSSRQGGRDKRAFDAVGTLRTIYRMDQGKTLDEALGILREAWGKVPTDGAILRGLADFLTDKRHLRIGIDRKRLVASLHRDGRKTHEVEARDLKPHDAPRRVGHFRAFVDSYNHGRRKDRFPAPWK